MAITTIGGTINSTAVTSNLDYKYGPYSSKQEAYNALGPSGLDKLAIGLTVGILEDGVITEYWFKEGTTLSDLVKKSEGLSAYEIAVQDGYEGTEEEWLASLKGEKGDNAVNPFKGWVDAVVTGEAGSRVITSETQNLPASPVKGDYAYVKTWDISGTAPEQVETPIVKIYECATVGTWSDSGRTADTSNVQSFASGEEVNDVHIINDLYTGGADDVLAAEQGKVLEQEISQLGQKTTMPSGEELAHTTITGAYINSFGNQSAWASTDIYLYPVTPGDYIYVNLGGGVSEKVRHYAFYTTNVISSANLVQVGPMAQDGAVDTVLKVPLGANYFAISRYTAPSVVMATIPMREFYKKFLVEYQVFPDEYVNGYYLSGNGNIASYGSAFRLASYSVVAGKTYQIRRTPTVSGSAKVWAVYNTTDHTQWSSETCVSFTSDAISAGNNIINVNIPTGGVCLVMTEYVNYYPKLYRTNKEFFNAQNAMDRIIALEREADSTDARLSNLESHLTGKFCAEFSSNGEDLFAAYLDGSIEYTFWFKKCMFNELYTFYQVGYRSVTRKYAETAGISAGTGITYINQTSSDNIGPFAFVTGGWVGGNHSLNNAGVCKTAITNSYTAFIDGKQLSAGDKLYGNELLVKVVNTLFDPSENVAEGQTILTIPAITESVNYLVRKNNIEVSLEEHILPDCNNVPSHYYGMQSMFNNETYMLTPRGRYDDWSASGSGSFDKEDYPHFNRFIEKNDSYYQSAYLIPNKDGAHGLLGNDQNIFSHNDSKGYHKIFMPGDFTQAVPGEKIVWSGVYTFFKNAVQDNSDALVYIGNINGKDAVFITTFRSCDINIPLSADFLGLAIKEIESSAEITTDNEFTDIQGIHINASGKGSAIYVLDRFNP